MIDEMPGIDGRNPLGFLAAIGVLTIVGGRLAWKPAGTGAAGWTPALTRDDDDRSLVAIVNETLKISPPQPPAPKKGGRPSLKEAQPKNPVPFGYKLAPDSERPFDDFKGDGDDVTAKFRFATAQTLRAALREPCTLADVERIVAHGAVTIASKNGGPATSVVRSLVAGGQVRYLKTLREIVETVEQRDIEEAIVDRGVIAKTRRRPRSIPIHSSRMSAKR